MSLRSERAQTFRSEIDQHGLVWALSYPVAEGYGWPNWMRSDYRFTTIFWSLESRVLTDIVFPPPTEIEGELRPRSVSVEYWRDRWLPSNRDSKCLVGLNWSSTDEEGRNHFTASAVLTWLG